MTAVVLVGDGDPFRLGLIDEACAAAGFDVVGALDGDSVLDAIARQPPALLLLHSTLTELSCVEVIRILKADPVLDGIPILVVGACDEAVDGVLEEPIRVTAIQSTVAEAIRRARERRRRRRESMPPPLRTSGDSGAGTRAQLLLTLDYELTHAARFHQPLSCLLVDTAPANADDVVALLQTHLRSIDPVFRAGHREVITILPDTDAEGALVARDRVAHALPKESRVAVVTTTQHVESTEVFLRGLRERLGGG